MNINYFINNSRLFIHIKCCKRGSSITQTTLFLYKYLTFLQYFVIAAPRGCSLLPSAVPTMASILLRGSWLPSTRNFTCVTSGVPWVIVPVLSNTTTFTCSKTGRLHSVNKALTCNFLRKPPNSNSLLRTGVHVMICSGSNQEHATNTSLWSSCNHNPRFLPYVPSPGALLLWSIFHSGLLLQYQPSQPWGWLIPENRDMQCTGLWWRLGKQSGLSLRQQKCSCCNPGGRSFSSRRNWTMDATTHCLWC